MSNPATGIDLTAHTARAVTIDAQGKVVSARSFSGTDAGAALDVAMSVARPTAGGALGIATHDPQVAEAVAARAPSGTPPTVSRAGDALAVAEGWVGAAGSARNVVCLWLGNRVLAGILLNGEPWRGTHGLAGFAAWLALNPVERQDYRKYGGFAAEMNDGGIARRLTWRVQAGDDSAVVERAGGLEAITATHVFEGARAGDDVAISVMHDTARYIAMAAVNLAVAVDPELVVIGGPITAARDLLLDPTRQEFDRRLPPPMVGQVRFEFSPLGEDAIAVGAARLAMLTQA